MLPPVRKMGTSGVFNVLDISPSINPVDIRGQKMPWSDILKPGPRDKVANLVGVALESIREQALAALHACRQIHGDRNLPEAERHRRAAKASAGLFVSAQSHVEKATAASAKAVEDLTKILSGPDVQLSDMRGIEIRTKLAGLPPEKRFAAVSRAIDRGDDSIVAALLGAGTERFLSEGILSDLELETVRSQWALARHPDEVRLLAKRRSDARYLETASAVARSWQQKTHLPAVAAGQPAGGQQRGPWPVPVDRGASTLESRAAQMTALLAGR